MNLSYINLTTMNHEDTDRGQTTQTYNRKIQAHHNRHIHRERDMDINTREGQRDKEEAGTKIQIQNTWNGREGERVVKGLWMAQRQRYAHILNTYVPERINKQKVREMRLATTQQNIKGLIVTGLTISFILFTAVIHLLVKSAE